MQYHQLPTKSLVELEDNSTIGKVNWKQNSLFENFRPFQNKAHEVLDSLRTLDPLQPKWSKVEEAKIFIVQMLLSS